MAKRGGAEMEILIVEGFGRRWNLASGTPMGEAMAYISPHVFVQAETLVMEMIVEEEELPVLLPRHYTLVTWHKYRVSLLMMQAPHRGSQAPHRGSRRFAAGLSLSVDPNHNYYIPPVIDDLVKDLKEVKYCILCGSRQSGKSTSILAAMDRIWKESQQLSVYLGFGLIGADESWDGQRFGPTCGIT
ncbi:hypothetical protein GOP47_0008047 [Adiantum capillus-veneris]|uniref:Uncharacterized protein n=1 Tax=Adiantum capillus-veneris TaxID=13818 RepID=A0A9D4ZJA7_ADICA|nr:hypothetical protein GOP47_0008047 [Adiantum capillus-veneris]